jgi:ABC-type transport system substrate-binding protein
VSKLMGRTGTPPGAGETPLLGGTLNWQQTANPPVLDPHASTVQPTFGLIGAVMSRPFAIKRTWDVAASYKHESGPNLALGAESPDARTWTLKLRPSVNFSNTPPVNGHPVLLLGVGG